MQIATFTNTRGESVEFGNSGPFVLQKIDGTANVSTEIKNTKSPYQDGSSFVGVQLSDRDIPIQGFINSNSQQQLYDRRRELTRILNPKLGPGKLVYTNSFRSYAIDVVADGGPVFGERFVHANLFVINFIANDPYWRDVETATKALRAEVGGLTFPLRLPTKFATASYRGVFHNTGDVETPVEIRYKGPATNPIVTNETTGKFIKVNCELLATDTLFITTEFGNKRVEILNADGSRTNVFHWIDLGSTFFQLEIGENILRYGSSQDSDQSPANVTVSWHNRFLGG
ncbi:hypothetical protein PMSD_18350 [Paenibacillus macquariensis subsp. defensor]|nr:hypothetical protein PMSD_18350 [Paenibacillus macquariensis subsp. defensor]